jgi:DNA repair protein RecN (Recombination protein N)
LVQGSHRLRLADLEEKECRVLDEKQVQGLWNDCFKAAENLYDRRLKASAELSQKVAEPLGRLGLGSALIEIQVEPLTWPEFSAELPGISENQAMVRMLFRPNPGEPARPLDRIASGGELSRLLLAILVCLANSDRVPTVILDEIDTGVGGRLCGVIGEVMAELSRHHQVLCVTHLPQIAACADKHFLVMKSRRSGRTCTTVAELDTPELRVKELAQMMRGSKADELTLKEAAAMLGAGGVSKSVELQMPCQSTDVRKRPRK